MAEEGGRASCEIHGLAVADDGYCVLCRRGASKRGAALPSLRALAVVASVAVLALGTYGVAKYGDWAETVVVGADPTAQPEEPAQLAEGPRQTRPRSASRNKRAARPAGAPQAALPAAAERSAAESGVAETDENADAEGRRPDGDREQKRREQRAAIDKEMRRLPIKIYMTTWCPVCTKARRWLTANGYRFTEYDVEKDSSAKRRQKQLNPKGSVPTLDIDGEVLVGFSPRSVERALRNRARRRLDL